MKNQYVAPELVEYGTVQEMTGWTGGANVDDTFTTLGSDGNVSDGPLDGSGSISICVHPNSVNDLSNCP